MKTLNLVLGVSALLLYSSSTLSAQAKPKTAAKMQEVNIEGRYAMSVPDYMTPGDDLNDEASLQYQNIYKEMYVIVIDEPSQDFIDVFLDLGEYDTSKTPLQNYAAAQMESIRSNMKTVSHESRLREVKTGCGTAMVYDVSGFQEGIEEEMGFTVAFVHGRLNLYMIMTWTFKKSQAQYQADMNAMIVSFRELSGAIANEKPPFTVTVPKRYQMTVDGSLTEDTSLNVDATLEYSNYTSELYIMVIEDPIDTFVTAFTEAGDYEKSQSPLDNYTRVQRRDGAEGMQKLNELGGVVASKVNGLDCRTFTMRGYVEGVEPQIFYKMRIVQGKDRFYYIMTWTLVSRRERHEPTMDMMLDSFKEL
jgi:hypothetical protein